MIWTVAAVRNDERFKMRFITNANLKFQFVQLIYRWLFHRQIRPLAGKKTFMELLYRLHIQCKILLEERNGRAYSQSWSVSIPPMDPVLCLTWVPPFCQLDPDDPLRIFSPLVLVELDPLLGQLLDLTVDVVSLLELLESLLPQADWSKGKSLL